MTTDMTSLDHTSSDFSSADLTWQVAELFPPQGQWTESDFFRLHGNRMVELVDGTLEILPMPTWLHQLMVKCLLRAVESAIGDDGQALDAPLPVRLFSKTIREPDVMYFAPGSEPADPRGYPDKVDLAMEVVSEGTEARQRDYKDKRADYLKAGVAEYWIVDPDDRQILVLVLDGDDYKTHGLFSVGQTATGKLLPELRVDVAALMNLGDKSQT